MVKTSVSLKSEESKHAWNRKLRLIKLNYFLYAADLFKLHRLELPGDIHRHPLAILIAATTRGRQTEAFYRFLLLF